MASGLLWVVLVYPVVGAVWGAVYTWVHVCALWFCACVYMMHVCGQQ